MFRMLLMVVALVASLASFAQVPDEIKGKNVNVYVGFPPGGVLDVRTRRILEIVKRDTGINFVVINKPGNSSNIAAHAAMEDSVSGVSMFVGDNGYLLSVINNTPNHMDRERMFPFITMWSSVFAVWTNYNAPFNTFAEALPIIRSNQNSYNYAITMPFSTLVFKSVFDHTDMKSVAGIPYKGTVDARTAMISGLVQFDLMNVGDALKMQEQKQGKVIAVGSQSRLPHLPNVPTLNETVPGLVATNHVNLYVSRSTPQSTIDFWNRVFNQALKDEELAKYMAESGVTINTSRNAQETLAFINRQNASLINLMKKIN